MDAEFDFTAMIDRIKHRKKELGYTNKQLSDISGVSFGTLNKILGSETKEPSINNIIRISAALGLSTDYVINGNKESTPPESRWDAIRSMIEELPEQEVKELLLYLRFLKWKMQERE